MIVGSSLYLTDEQQYDIIHQAEEYYKECFLDQYAVKDAIAAINRCIARLTAEGY